MSSQINQRCLWLTSITESKKWRRKGGIRYLQCLPLGAIATHFEALFPRKWLNIVCAHATFCFSKLPYEKTHELFSILFSPFWGMVEQLGGHLRVQTGSTHHRLTEIRILNLMETCMLSYYLRFIVKHFPRPLCLHLPIVPL